MYYSTTKFQASLLHVVVSFSFSAALKCYNCQYVEGTTDRDCKDNLRADFLYDVPPYPGVHSSPNTAVEATKLGEMFNSTNAKQNVAPLCQKIAGKVDGTEAIIRSGVYGAAAYAGTCESESSGGDKATACWCDTDGCNGDTDDGSGDGEGGNGGGGVASATAFNLALVSVGATFALLSLI